MLRYFFTRLLWFLPTLWLISIIVFFLAKSTEGNSISPPRFLENMSPKQEAEYYKTERQRRGLDLPLFYFSIYRASQTDTAYLLPERHKKALLSLAYHCRNWPKVDQFYADLKKAVFQEKLSQIAFYELCSSYDRKSLEENSLKWADQLSALPLLAKDIEAIQQSNFTMLHNYLFKISFNGFENQYHLWLQQIIDGKWVHSSLSEQDQNKQLLRALIWTLGMSLTSLFLAFVFALLLGIWSFHPKWKKASLYLEKVFLGLYATPNFLMATVLIFFFASGHVLKWLPVYGIGEVNESDSLFSLLKLRIPYLILPLICYTYPVMAYFFEQIRSNLFNQLKADYLLTAQAKGLSFFSSLQKHALPNAIIPLISLVGSSIPALISGSFIIESIFNLPGMGKLSVEAFLSRDYNLIFTITLIGAALTLLGNLISDFAYHLIDPRISLHKTENAS